MAGMTMHGPPAPSTVVGIDQSREASGTSWEPESTPMFMWHFLAGGWTFGLHTNTFIGYDDQDTDRGDARLVSMNWLMGTARHAIGGGDVLFHAMLSAEPFTLPGDGYPLLLQTGESFGGMRLHDRQHPHDLFMELSARLREPIGDGFAFDLYAAPVGEPAIGPTAYPHRFSAMPDPLAPLGHHWEDATHISFGVVTAGVFTKTLKLEGSWFNGREPDEDRTDFDFRAFDSAAVRLSVNPSRDLTAQVSWAWLASPEELEATISVQRLTASAIWNHRLAENGDIAVTAVYGRNQPSAGPSTNAGLVEASLFLEGRYWLFARAEALDKTGQELELPAALADERFAMGSFSAGYVYDFTEVPAIVPGVGFVGTVDVIGTELGSFYGTRAPLGGIVFVRLRAPEMRSHGHAM